MRTVAIDQYGKIYKIDGKHPRKELLELLGYRSAQKLWIDTPNGTKHTGYCIGGLWLSIYKMQPIHEVQS